MGVSLKLQKRLAASVLGCGLRKASFCKFWAFGSYWLLCMWPFEGSSKHVHQ